MPRDLLAEKKRAPRDLLAEKPVNDITAQRDKFYSSGIYSGRHNPLGPIARAIDAGARGIQSGVLFNFDDELGLSTNEEKAALRRESPIASTVGEVAGGLGVGGVAVRGGLSLLNGAKATLPSLAGRGAAEGAVYGSIYGLGEGAGLEDRLKSAGRGAVVGGGMGAAGGVVARIGIGKDIAKRTPSVEQLKQAGHAAYEAAERAGVIFSKSGMQKLGHDIVATLRNRAFTPENNPEVVAFLRAFQRDGSGHTTFKGLDTLRKTASNGISGARDSTKAMLSEIIEKIDNFIDAPGNISVLTGDMKAGAKAIKEARAFWSRAKKTELIDEALLKAERRAASNFAGAGEETAARQNIRKILDSKKLSRGFTDTERAAMERVVRGTTGQNIARYVGKFAPSSPFSGAVSTGVGGAIGSMVAGPVGAGIGAGTTAAAGLLGRQIAKAGATKNAALLEAVIRSGGKVPPPTLSGSRKAIADALMRSGALALP